MKHSFVPFSITSLFIIFILLISQAPIIQSSPIINIKNNDHFEIETDNIDNIFSDKHPQISLPPILSSPTVLPDLVFITLKAYWGPINTSAEGLFVRYEVQNVGYSYNHSQPIKSNLTFYADNNEKPFGFIIQTPFFYPDHWYEGEILGGNFFFDDLHEKPQQIRVQIDTNNSIAESNEVNNNQTSSVIDAVIISGTIYRTENEINTPITSIVQIRGCNPQSLLDIEYRTFRSDEQGMYSMSFYPEEPVTTASKYHLLIQSYNDGTLMLSTPLLRSGQQCTLNAYFKGLKPEQPQRLIGFRTGLVNRTYLFFTSSHDSDENALYYKFSWGDGNYSDWIGPIESNTNVWFSHSWNTTDTYTIKVITKDETGLLSEWSNPFQITIRDLRNLNIGWILDIIRSIITS